MHGSDARWFVIKTTRFKENYVKAQVTEATGADAYVPMVKIPRCHVRRGQAQFEPCFPGYVFAQLDPTAHLFKLRRLHAVNSLVCFDGRPAWVPPAVIDDLRRRERGRGYINLHVAAGPLAPSACVRVVDGPFSGQTGLFVRYLDGAERVRILLDGLQARVILEVPLNAVTVAPLARATAAGR